MTDADGAPGAAPEPVSPSKIRWLWWGIGAALAAGLLAFVLRGADQPKNPSLLPAGVTTKSPEPAGASATRTSIPGFGETTITVHLPSGQDLQWCVLLASTGQQQEKGLMGITDTTLGGYDGMLFRFPRTENVAFYMKDTPMPLSIAFFGTSGALVSQTDMAPCGDQQDCPLYHADAPYLNALEVPQGALARLGIAAKSSLTDEQRACTS